MQTVTPPTDRRKLAAFRAAKAKSHVRALEIGDPEAYQWALMVISEHNEYRVRKYPGRWFCWADCTDPRTGKDIPLNPWPASRYPKNQLILSLAWHYRNAKA